MKRDNSRDTTAALIILVLLVAVGVFGVVVMAQPSPERAPMADEIDEFYSR